LAPERVQSKKTPFKADFEKDRVNSENHSEEEEKRSMLVMHPCRDSQVKSHKDSASLGTKKQTFSRKRRRLSQFSESAKSKFDHSKNAANSKRRKEEYTKLREAKKSSKNRLDYLIYLDEIFYTKITDLILDQLEETRSLSL
jgi:hypothetical protein